MKVGDIFLSYPKRFRNLSYSIAGLIYAFKNEKNLQILLFFEVLTLGMALWWGRISATEFYIVLLGFAFLNGLEMFNSAVERLADMVQPELDPRVKIIKDLLAGGVFLAGAAAFTLWFIFVFF